LQTYKKNIAIFLVMSYILGEIFHSVFIHVLATFAKYGRQIRDTQSHVRIHSLYILVNYESCTKKDRFAHI